MKALTQICVMKKPAIQASFTNYALNDAHLLELKKSLLAGREMFRLEILAKRKQWALRLIEKKKTAFKKGYDYGMKHAREESSAVIKAARQVYENSIKQANQDCLELAISIAERIIQDQVRLNKSALHKRISKSIESLLTLNNLKIFVHENDQEEIIASFKKLPSSTQIIADNSILPGNAIIESESGCVELNWQTQLKIMQTQLFEKIQLKLANDLKFQGASNAASF